MEELQGKDSQESLSSDDFVNVDNPTSETSSPDIEGEGSHGDGGWTGEQEKHEDKSSEGSESKLGTAEVQTIGVQEMTGTRVARNSVTTQAQGVFSFLNVLHPVVLYVIYWKDVKLSAVILTMVLVLQYTLLVNTLLHTVVLLLLASMIVSLVYIVTKIAVDSFYNREICNPFQLYLDRKEGIPEDVAVDFIRYVIPKINCYFNLLVKLVFFEDTFASLKFIVFLFLVSYITNILDLLCAGFLATIFLFAVPCLYSRHQERIDEVIQGVAIKITSAIEEVKKMVPFLFKVKKQ